LSNPEDFIFAVEESRKSGNHGNIHSILKNRNINLGTPIAENICGKERTRTVLRKLLEEVPNGDAIVRRELDIHVNHIGENENCLNYAAEIDFEAILRSGSVQQTVAVYDLLDIRANEKNDNLVVTELFKHPVVALFIAAKWEKTKSVFYLQTLVYVLFLLFFSIFVIHLFTRTEVYCSQLEKFISRDGVSNALKINSSEKIRSFDECSRGDSRITTEFLEDTKMQQGYIAIIEIFFLLFFSILTSLEVYQAMYLGKQYFRELENYIEWVVLLSALVLMVFKYSILQDTWQASTVRGLVGLGNCAAWLELTIIIGRYPFRGGDFSIMFYNIIKKILRHTIAMFLMIMGFAFAQMVVNYGHDEESFENPIKSFMMTLTMALGEYNFIDIYNSYRNDRISRGFAMILLVLLILFGTIAMVNLFIAVIISDISQLREDVYTQNLGILFRIFNSD